MPLAKDIENLDEPIKKFIEEYEASIAELEESIKKRKLSKAHQTLDSTQVHTIEVAIDREHLQQTSLEDEVE